VGNKPEARKILATKMSTRNNLELNLQRLEMDLRNYKLALEDLIYCKGNSFEIHSCFWQIGPFIVIVRMEGTNRNSREIDWRE